MKLRINEKETPNIEVKHEGILEVPEGKNVDDLPLSHFVNLANKKGLSKITKALNNLQVWNKNDDPKLSKWAGNMIDKLNKKLKKNEDYRTRTYPSNFNINDLQDFLDTFTEKTLETKYDFVIEKVAKKFRWTVKDTKAILADVFAYGDEEDFEESLNEKDERKSYWKYYINDPAIKEMEDDTYYDNYFDEKTIRRVKLYPCKTEEDCYVDDYSGAVCSYEYPHNAIFGTKDEAYKELMTSWNTSEYEYRNDL